MSATDVRNNSNRDTLSSSSTLRTRTNDEIQARASTIQSTSDAGTLAQPVISNQRAATSFDESRPIKTSDSNIDRNYNTSGTTLPAPSPQPRPTANPASQGENSLNATKTEERQPWYKRIAEKYGSVTLENKASVARDHLALERTFLAWLRTSLSFASIGIAVTQLFRLNSGASRSQSVQSYSAQSILRLPFSPLVGHAIPAEVIPYLQHLLVQHGGTTPKATLGPTLLDQLLQLSPEGLPVNHSGYSVTQFDDDTAGKLRHVGKPLGATFIGISVIVLLVGFQRYFEAQHWIIHGKFPASRGSISLVAFVAFALIVASLVVVIVISPNSHET